MKDHIPSLLVLTIIVALGAIPAAAKPAGGWEANKPADNDVVLPLKAVAALLGTPWVIKYYHGANAARLQSRHVPEDAKLEVNKTPVVVDGALRKPHEDFARFEITGAEEVRLLRGYAVTFRYPSEGVVGKVLLVPELDHWRVVPVSGAET